MESSRFIGINYSEPFGTNLVQKFLDDWAYQRRKAGLPRYFISITSGGVGMASPARKAVVIGDWH